MGMSTQAQPNIFSRTAILLRPSIVTSSPTRPFKGPLMTRTISPRANGELFMSLAPTVDDVWFWAAAVSKGTYVVPLPNGQHRCREIGKPKELSLKTTNLKPGDDRNYAAFRKILESFPAIKRRLGYEKQELSL